MNTHTQAPGGRRLSFYDDLTRDLIAELTEAEVRRLHTKLQTLGRDQWWDWLQDHLEDIERYIANSPRDRKKLLAKAEDGLLLKYGAIWTAQLPAVVDPWFHDPCLQGELNDPVTRAARSRLLAESLFAEIDEWPFDEPPLPNPFSASDQPGA